MNNVIAIDCFFFFLILSCNCIIKEHKIRLPRRVVHAMIINGMVIDMENPNALIAIAHVTENAQNPYYAFCEYVKYCMMTSPEDVFTEQDIRDAVNKEFGIRIPHHVIVKCLNCLSDEQFVSLEENHVIRRIGSFDVPSFEQARTSFRDTETALITELIDYVRKYGKDWTEEYAREQLVGILSRDSLAYDVFFQDYSTIQNKTSDSKALDDEYDEDSEGDDSQPMFPDITYAGKFITDTISTDSPTRDYLVKICEGLMVCVGTYQLPSNGNKPTIPSIKGTSFFFDTRLLLRYLGCAGDAATESAQELVSLIQNNGGAIYYYPHTFQEMYDALDHAKRQLDRGDLPYDSEMFLYSKKVKHNPMVFAAKRDNLKQELAKAHIYRRDLQDYSEKDKLRFGFSLDDLKCYMEENTNWDRTAVLNDACSIWETHMSRAGNYQFYFGTADRISVFVTTNSRLISLALGYKDARPANPALANWKPNRLPVITDGRLTCRLWTPATENDKLPIMRLAANAVAAQQPTRRYYEKVKALALQLKEQVPEYSQIALSEFFDDELSDAILRKTEGNEAAFDIGTLASSVSELVELKTRDQKQEVDAVKAQRDFFSGELDRHKQSVVDGAVDQWKNKMGLCGLWLRAIINWNCIAAPIIAVLTAILGSYINNHNIWWISGAIIILSLAERFSSSRFIARVFLKKALPTSKENYRKKIVKNLRPIEHNFEEEIIERVFTETDLLQKCEDIVDKSSK